MRFMKITLAALLLCLLPVLSLAQSIEIGSLIPLEMTPEEHAQMLPLYCGPTQGFHRCDEQTLDTGKPYVVFGQYDCWAMVGIGTGETLGAIGWVESAAIDAPIMRDTKDITGFVRRR